MSRRVEVFYDNDPRRPNVGKLYLHCRRCLAELKRRVTEGGDAIGMVSPAQYARTQVALTDDGFQVWCNRHDCNVSIITFGGGSDGREAHRVH